jgi:hypothetical protein
MHRAIFLRAALAAVIFACSASIGGAAPDEGVTPAEGAASPSFLAVPQLQQGFRLLYEQDFPRAREVFIEWQKQNPEAPLGPVAVAASALFEEFYHQGVLTSDFFLNDRRFLGGIEGKPDPKRMRDFRTAIAKARRLASARLARSPQDAEALYAMTLAAGMESDADMILEKQHLEALRQMKAGEEYARRLLAVMPGICDADVALGAAHYIIGSLSPAARFALWFGNIHGNKKLGMREVSVAADCGQYLRPFAKILLALAARREHQDALAQKELAELTAEFPASPLFAAEYAKAMHRPIPATMNP